MQTTKIDAGMRVNEVISAVPDTLPVFGRWGIDACCGGARTLADVAERHGFDLDLLLEELNAVAG